MRVIAGCYDGSLHGWKSSADEAAAAADAASGAGDFKLIFAYKAHLSCAKCLAVSDNACPLNTTNGARVGQEWLASGGTDEVVRVYHLGRLQEVGELLEHTDTVLCLAFVGNKFLLSGGQDGQLCVWRCRDWSCVSSLKGHKPGPVTSLAVHPSGKLALSTSRDNSLRMWNLTNGRPASRNRLKSFRELSLATFSPSGSHYAVVADDRTLLVFAVDNMDGKPHAKVALTTRINAVCFYADSAFALGLEDGKVATYSLDGAEQATMESGARVRQVARLEVPGRGVCLVAGLSTGEAQIWDLKTGDKLDTLKLGSGAHLTCLATSPAEAKPKAGAAKAQQTKAETGGKRQAADEASDAEPGGVSTSAETKATKATTTSKKKRKVKK